LAEAIVKSGIHPDYNKASITCACGNVIETYSARGSYTVDVCSSCHPFYTGKQKLLDTAGRVDRFRKKYAKAQKNA
jgi:large subunit ribosomal protein L31